MSTNYLNPIIGLIHNQAEGRWHPVLFSESPLPGPPAAEKPVRHKSRMHHTEGFATRDEAVKYAREDLGPKTGCTQFALDEDIEWDGKDIPATVVFSSGQVVTSGRTSEQTDDPKLVIVTADKIKETGTVSFRFMVDSKMPPHVFKLTFGKPFGYIWKDGTENSYAFNVWQSGEGLKVAGGWTPHDEDAWRKEMADAIPPCTLLMTTEVYTWFWANILNRYHISYVRHHAPEVLVTN